MAITSDDLFFSKEPNKTLIVGGGYVAVECAGFISGLHYDTTIMTRRNFLNEFDKDISNIIMEDLKTLNKVFL